MKTEDIDRLKAIEHAVARYIASVRSRPIDQGRIAEAYHALVRIYEGLSAFYTEESDE